MTGRKIIICREGMLQAEKRDRSVLYPCLCVTCTFIWVICGRFTVCGIIAILRVGANWRKQAVILRSAAVTFRGVGGMERIHHMQKNRHISQWPDAVDVGTVYVRHAVILHPGFVVTPPASEITPVASA